MNREYFIMLTLTGVLLAGCATGKAHRIEQRVGTDLSQTVISVDLDDVPFVDVVQFWSDETQVPVFVNWKALELSGIDRTTPVTLHSPMIPADMALRFILDDVGGGFVLLDFVWVDGHVVVSTQEEFDGPAYRETVVYDVRPLLAGFEDNDKAGEFIVECIKDALNTRMVWDGPTYPEKARLCEGRLVVDCRPDQHEIIRDLLSELKYPESIQSD